MSQALPSSAVCGAHWVAHAWPYFPAYSHPLPQLQGRPPGICCPLGATGLLKALLRGKSQCPLRPHPQRDRHPLPAPSPALGLKRPQPDHLPPRFCSPSPEPHPSEQAALVLPRSWREEGSHLERKVGQTVGKVECQAQGRRRCPLGSDRRLLSRGSDVHKVIFWKECSSLWAQEELEEKKRKRGQNLSGQGLHWGRGD